MKKFLNQFNTRSQCTNRLLVMNEEIDISREQINLRKSKNRICRQNCSLQCAGPYLNHRNKTRKKANILDWC